VRRSAQLTVAAVVLAAVTGCGGSTSGSTSGRADPDESTGLDTATCLRDAHAVTSYPDGFARSFPMPPGTVVYHVDDRGGDGVVATGVTGTPFPRVLAALNGPAQKAGFRVTSGETEEDDAEANWAGNGYVGRWAIKKSASCPGETVVQVLAKRG